MLLLTTTTMLSAITMVGVSFSSSTTNAFAQACVDPMQPCHGTPPLTPGAGDDPECWGEVTSGLAQDSGGVGEHSSNPIPEEEGEEIDRETPRSGIGNMPEDTPGEHGEAVGEIFGQTCEDEIRD